MIWGGDRCGFGLSSSSFPCASLWKHWKSESPISPDLENYIREDFDEPAALKERLETLAGGSCTVNRVELPDRTLTWPTGRPTTASAVSSKSHLGNELGFARGVWGRFHLEVSLEVCVKESDDAASRVLS